MNRRELLQAVMASTALAAFPMELLLAEPAKAPLRGFLCISGMRVYGTLVGEPSWAKASILRDRNDQRPIMSHYVNTVGGHLEWSAFPMQELVFLTGSRPSLVLDPGLVGCCWGQFDDGSPYYLDAGTTP